MSKSNAVEIIAILYLILATQLHGGLRTLAVLTALVNVFEAMYFAHKEKWL